MSEEKTLPPSAKKLREAREKGQVAKAPDLVLALSATALLAYVFAGSGWIGGRLKDGIVTTAELSLLPFDDALRLVVPVLGGVLLKTVAPAFALVVLTVAAANFFVNGGFIFAFDPLMPKLETIDPIKGIGKLFKMKAMVELLKSVLKAALIGTVMYKLASVASTTLVQIPFCGARCIPAVASEMLRPMIASACGLYLAVGLADVLVQKWLFRRDLKMSLTEQKRERKDQDGDPHVRGARKQRRREAASGGLRLGLAQATLLIAGRDQVIGLRYKRGEVEFPTVVCRSSGEPAAAMVADARRAFVPVFWDPNLASKMTAKLRPGARITPQFFQPVAHALYASGAVRR